MKKKIVFLTYDSPYIDRRTLLMASSFLEKGFKVTIITPFAYKEELEKLALSKKVKLINLVDYYPSVNFLNILKKVTSKILPPKLQQIVKNIYRKYTYANYIPFYEEMLKMGLQEKGTIYVAVDLPTLPIAVKIKNKLGSWVIYDAHEFFIGQKTLSEKQKKQLFSIEKQNIKKVDAIITVNKYIKELLEKTYNLEKDKIFVVHNSLPCEEKSYIKSDYLHFFNKIKKNNKYVIIYQGGFLENRNLEKLISIAKHFSFSALVMLGWGPLEGKLKRLAGSFLNKKIFFVKKIPFSELIPFTSQADAGIIPYPAIDLNTKYCSPNKFFEYICAEIPIIANKDLIFIKENLEKYHSGIFIDFDKNVKELAKDIENFLNSKNYTGMKKNVTTLKEVYSWKIEKKRLNFILDTIISKNVRNFMLDQQGKD